MRVDRTDQVVIVLGIGLAARTGRVALRCVPLIAAINGTKYGQNPIGRWTVASMER